MSSPNSQSQRNPTVEEVEDESELNFNPAAPDANHKPSWPEICSQHESVLSAHLEALNLVKSHVVPDGDAFRTISSMVEKTHKLMSQFKILQKQLVHRKAEFVNMPNTFARPNGQNDKAKSTSSSAEDGQANTTTSLPDRSKGGRKRARTERDSMTAENTEPEHIRAEPFPSGKRKRTHLTIPGSDEDVRNATPVAMETEDISEEVRRRLQIKEEQRKKSKSKPEKRKRESILSNGSVSSPGGTSKPKRKKTKHRPGPGEYGKTDELKSDAVQENLKKHCPDQIPELDVETQGRVKRSKKERHSNTA